MMGTIWINSGLGLLAFVVTMATAWTSNVWLVSLERAGVAFLVFFLAAFPIRWVLTKVTQTSVLPSASEGEASSTEGSASPEKGKEEGEAEADGDSFTPLSISQVERIRPIEDPTTVAEVVRRLTDE